MFLNCLRPEFLRDTSSRSSRPSAPLPYPAHRALASPQIFSGCALHRLHPEMNARVDLPIHLAADTALREARTAPRQRTSSVVLPPALRERATDRGAVPWR